MEDRDLNWHPEVIRDFLAETYGRDYVNAIFTLYYDYKYDYPLSDEQYKALQDNIPGFIETNDPKLIRRFLLDTYGRDCCIGMRKVCNARMFDDFRCLTPSCILTDSECDALKANIPGLSEYLSGHHY